MRFMRTVPVEQRKEIRVCFPVVDPILRKESSTFSINKELEKLIKGSNEPLTEQRIKEIFAEINEIIHQWPQLRVL